MIAYNKILDLITKYLNVKKDKNKAEVFCNEYMNLFYDLSDNLESELPRTVFEALDDINLLCDSYEKNPLIRKEDKYCIDEHQLTEKIKLLIDKIKNIT